MHLRLFVWYLPLAQLWWSHKRRDTTVWKLHKLDGYLSNTVLISMSASRLIFKILMLSSTSTVFLYLYLIQGILIYCQAPSPWAWSLLKMVPQVENHLNTHIHIVIPGIVFFIPSYIEKRFRLSSDTICSSSLLFLFK